MLTKRFLTAALTFSLLGSVWLAGAVRGEPVRMDDIEGLETALSLQRVFATVAERVSPAVVVITNKQVRRAPDHMQMPPAFRFFFGIPEPEPERRERPRIPQPAGRGSGVIIRAQGYVLTNYHVIRDHDELELMLHDGTVYSTAREQLTVVGIDQHTDLAVLKINGEEDLSLPYLQFADTEQLRVGDWTIAVGAPFNFDYSVTVGVVSQKGRHGMRLHALENYIQTDASINPGNSGGPLLNVHGEIVGINNFIVTGGGLSRGNTGVGFAIDGGLARQVAEGIIDEGEVVRPWLGISMQELDSELKREFGVEWGVLVSEAIEGDPAAESGVRAGDVILKVGDQEVESARDVQFAVLGYRPGDAIDLLVHRDGEQMTISVVAGKRDADGSRAEDTTDVLAAVGLRLEVNAAGALVVVAVAPDSPAEAAGLQRGDILREVNRQSVDEVAQAVRALQASRGGVAVLYVERRGSRFFVPLRVVE